MSLQGKVFLITGGSKGIGRAIAKRAAGLGASVVINYARDSQPAEALVQELGAERALAVQADASKVPEIERLVGAAVDRFGRIDVLVANAGIMPLQPLAATTEEIFDRVYDLNVKGPFFLAQKAAPHIPSGGRIVLVSTGVARSTAVAPPYLLYASSKGAVEQMTRVMAKDLGAKGITVNAVAPGPTATDLFLEGKPEALIKGIASQSPFNRLGEPDEIANVVTFLASPESAWVSGQIIGANGASFV
jgi:3-oxoacyl-[acyl-carrier protein] reductase